MGDKETYRTIQQLLGGILRKRCSEYLQQIYRRTPLPKGGLNQVAWQLY